HHPDQADMRSPRRHEIDQRGRSVRRLELRLEDQRSFAVLPFDLVFTFGSDQPAPMLGGAEKRGEAGGRIESWQAEAVDRTVLSNEGPGVAVTDQGVIFDARRHGRVRYVQNAFRAGLGTSGGRCCSSCFADILLWLTLFRSAAIVFKKVAVVGATGAV